VTLTLSNADLGNGLLGAYEGFAQMLTHLGDQAAARRDHARLRRLTGYWSSSST
jgi:hypothetical protein